MKQPKPWFRASKNAWFVEHHGRQVRLGSHPDGAPEPVKTNGCWNAPQSILSAFYKVMAADPANLPKPSSILVAQIADLFLDYAEKHNQERTYHWYRDYLQDFCKKYGRIRAIELKPFHISRWLDSHLRWGTSKRCAVTAIKRAFNWADTEGILSPSPIRSVKKPPMPSRARTLSLEERSEILAAIPDQQFRDFVTAMQETGCRPSEVARVTAADVNLELGVWVLHQHKTATKTGKPRVIYLTKTIIELSKRLMTENPEGPLFRGVRGRKPYGMHGVCSRFRRLRQKLPHLKNAIAYAYRHSFATDALTKNIGMATVAELLGHRDTSMVSRFYGHLGDQVEHMRDAAARAASQA